MSQEVINGNTVDTEAERSKLVADTAIWLGKATHLMNEVREMFPNKHLILREYGNDRNSITNRGLESGRIVLPARPLAGFNHSGPLLTRRSAVTIEMIYNARHATSVDTAVMRNLEVPLSVPDVVRIGLGHPVANANEADRPANQKFNYPTDSWSLSGNQLDLYGWSVMDFGASLPNMRPFVSCRDEVQDFPTFCSYPEEALRQRPDAVEFHRSVLNNFINTLGDVALAIYNPNLNPRA